MYPKEKKNLPRVEYMGKMVPQEHFRTYIYSKDDKKLVNSWKEYQACVATGLWFDTVEQAQEQKPKRRTKTKE